MISLLLPFHHYEHCFECKKFSLRALFWFSATNLGTYELAVIDNMASRQASLSGNIALDAQAHGIFLLHQENAQTAKIWPMSTIKKVEVVPTDIPQDSEKILSIVIKDPTKGYVTIQ